MEYHCIQSQSLLVLIDSILSNARVISVVLRPVVLPYIRALRNTTFQQNNARLHVASIVRLFLYMKKWLAAGLVCTFSISHK